MNARLLPLILCLLAIVAIPVETFAQSGKITGRVVDATDGEPLPGANVFIEGTTIGAPTDIEGRFLILNVPPGTYKLVARFLGYVTQTTEGVIVRTDLTTEINFTLRTESFVGEEVVVQANRDVIIKDLTSTEARVSREEIAKLPVQELRDVVQLQAGVSVSSSGSIHIRGGRSTEVSYIVDGVRVTDNFDNSQGVRIENNSVQELQVISGTFNAEYGQAMSGIINVVTKSGSNKYDGNFRVWAGDYLTSNGNIFNGTNTSVTGLSPRQQYNIDASLSGPIIKDKLTFFITGRHFKNDGWLYGINAYSPLGPFIDTLATGGVNRFGDRVDFNKSWYLPLDTLANGNIVYRDTGARDSALVAMNTFETVSAQGNLQFNVSNKLRFNLIGLFGNERGRGYDHQNRTVPDGRSQSIRQNYSLNLKTTFTPSNNTFITANLAQKENNFESYLYKDPYDLRYFNYQRLDGLDPIFTPGQSGRFNRLGTSNGFFERNTRTLIGKIELSSQVNQRHFLKTGIEFQSDVLDYDSFSLQPVNEQNGVTAPPGVSMGIPPINTIDHQLYRRKPYSAAAFIQDKMEYENLIINIGLRFDYFNANANVPADPKDPDIFNPFLTENRNNSLEQRESYWYRKVDPKFALSPRLGVAYPISDRGVVRFSYGYFFQIPEYDRLFTRDQIILEENSGIYGIFGNPDLKPQKTIQYELGLQQEIFSGTAIDVTGFYRDIRDWISSGPTTETYIPSVRYGTWINRDYANVRGITASLNQNLANAFSVRFDYTFSIAEGSNSDPAAEFFAALSRNDTTGSALTKLLRPLDWDRKHIFNSSLFYTGKSWGMNILQKFQTGNPYTPDTSIPSRVGINASTDVLTNSLVRPSNLSVDVNAYKDFNIKGQTARVFLNVFNVFDSRNPINVYGDSGRPESPLLFPANFDPGFYTNPTFYSEPRRVQFGVQLSFY